MGELLFCSRLPEAVQVAVSENAFNLLTLVEGEGGFRRIGRAEDFSVDAVVCLEDNPADEVLRHHRMRHGTDSYLDNVAYLVADRHMLLMGSIYGTGHQLLRFLASAGQRCAGIVNHLYDVAALLAMIKLWCHEISLLLYL